ncbi:MAG: glutathione S-transferase family protein [Pseudomonadota bacterium]
MAKVPALGHEGTVITEVAAIIAYLCDFYAQKGLAPAPSTVERGVYYRWMFFGAGPLDGAVSHAGLGLIPETPQDQGRVGYGSLDRVCDTLEGVLADQDWIVGSDFTAADVVIASQLGFALMMGTIADRPILSGYVARAMARPAAIRARELDDALAAEMAGTD